MKIRLFPAVTAALCMLLAPTIGQNADFEQSAERVRRRVAEGQPAAFDEVLSWEPKNAVAFLKPYLWRRAQEPRGPQYAAALDALRRMPNIVGHFSSLLDESVSQNSNPHSVGETLFFLGQIRTNAAVSLAGRYANSKILLRSDPDASMEDAETLSLIGLHDMRLPGAPYFGPDQDFTSEQFQRMKTWWNQNANHFAEGNPQELVPFEVKQQESNEATNQRGKSTPAVSIVTPQPSQPAKHMAPEADPPVNYVSWVAILAGILIVGFTLFALTKRS